jgi:hypothetical protein
MVTDLAILVTEHIVWFMLCFAYWCSNLGVVAVMCCKNAAVTLTICKNSKRGSTHINIFRVVLLLYVYTNLFKIRLQ